MTLHLKSRGYPFRPRLLFSSFIVVGGGFPTVYYFRRGQPEKSQEGNSFWNSYIRQIKHDTVCLNEGSDPFD